MRPRVLYSRPHLVNVSVVLHEVMLSALLLHLPCYYSRQYVGVVLVDPI